MSKVAEILSLDDTQEKIVGDTGEELVRNLFARLNTKVVMSTDYYDSEKDMTVNGWSLEVKTIIPFFLENAFSIPISQVHKCVNAQILVFVEVSPYSEHIPLWMCFDRRYRTRRTKDRREVALFDVCRMWNFANVTDENVTEVFRQYSESSLSRKQYEQLRKNSAFNRTIL